jgi:hypothetical protein
MWKMEVQIKLEVISIFSRKCLNWNEELFLFSEKKLKLRLEVLFFLKEPNNIGFVLLALALN